MRRDLLIIFAVFYGIPILTMLAFLIADFRRRKPACDMCKTKLGHLPGCPNQGRS